MNADDLRDPQDLTPPPEDASADGDETLTQLAADLPDPPTVTEVQPNADHAPDTWAMLADAEAAPVESAPLDVAQPPQPEPQPEPEPPPDDPVADESYDLPQALFDAGFDVEGALGALAFDQGSAADEDLAPAVPRLPPFTPPNYRPALAMPRPLTVRRGQLSSLIPALVLIGLGAWWTVANITGTPIDPLLAGAVLAGGLVLTLVVTWLINGRWARGLLLLVVLALFAAGGGALLLNAGPGNAISAYPLLLSALGVAILLTGLLGRPRERAWLGPAVVFIAAGIVGYLVVNGAVPAGILSAATAYWFVPAVLLLILVALPLFVRRRD